MGRKGNLVLNTMAKAIIGLVLLLVISTILFMGDNSLFPKLKQLIPRGDQYIPRDYQDTPSDSVTKQLDRSKKMFEDLFQTAKTLATMEIPIKDGKPEYDYCFAYVDGEAMSQFHWDRAQKILIRNTDGNLQMELLGLFEDAKEGYLANGKLWSPAYPPITIENAQLCLVGGSGGQADNFYAAWLGENANGVASTNQYRYPKTAEGAPGGQVVTYAWDIYEGDDWLTESNELEWENRKGADFVLFMHNDGNKRNICIFPTQDGLNKCKVRSSGYLDDECFLPYNPSNFEKNPIYKVIEDNHYRLLNEKGQCTPGGG